jgi:hypothetical protein
MSSMYGITSIVPDLIFDIASKSLIYQSALKWTIIGDKRYPRLANSDLDCMHCACYLSVTTCMDNRDAPNSIASTEKLDHVEAPNGPRCGVIHQKYGTRNHHVQDDDV